MFKYGFETPPGRDLEGVLAEADYVTDYPKKKNADAHVLS
jgi:hypothetical protein